MEEVPDVVVLSFHGEVVRACHGEDLSFRAVEDL
jgi:hypothetical protein